MFKVSGEANGCSYGCIKVPSVKEFYTDLVSLRAFMNSGPAKTCVECLVSLFFVVVHVGLKETTPRCPLYSVLLTMFSPATRLLR